MVFADGTGSQSWSSSTTSPTGRPKVGSAQPLLFLLSTYSAGKVSSLKVDTYYPLQYCDGQDQVNEKDEKEEKKNQTKSSGPELPSVYYCAKLRP